MSNGQQWQWQTPPGWPPPPPGWSPPPGWGLDPSWPPPPPDWVWWRLVPTPGNRRGVAAKVLLGVAGAVVGLIALGAAMVGLMTLMGFGDPAGFGNAAPPGLGQFDLRNDTAAPVTVGNCQGPGCMPAESQDRVPPGQVVAISTDTSGTGDGLTSWQVTSAEGAVLGYIVLGADHADDGTTVQVSALSPDRSTPTPVVP